MIIDVYGIIPTDIPCNYKIHQIKTSIINYAKFHQKLLEGIDFDIRNLINVAAL